MNLERAKHLEKHLDRKLVDLEQGIVLGRKTKPGKKGYIRINVHYKSYGLHEVIAYFGGLDIIGKTVDHLDMDKTNNSIHNLEAVSIRENTLRGRRNHDYSYLHGSKNPERDAKIRADYATGKYTQKTLCVKYGLKKSRMSTILKG